MEKKTALIISTGGTIASGEGAFGAAPSPERARAAVLTARNALEEKGFAVRVTHPFGHIGIDSSDMSPRLLLDITKLLCEARAGGVKNFLITHGTDTMAYTAAWLSLTAPHDVKTVLTGSQRTRDAADFDGEKNIRGAAELLSKRGNGVFVYFRGEKFGGAFVHKESSTELDAYISTCELKGRASNKISPVRLPLETLNATNAALDAAARGVETVVISPVCRPRFDLRRKIFILQGYGSGNMPRAVRETIKAKFAGRGRKHIFIAASSCARGAKNPSAYGEVGMAALARDGFSVYGQGSYSFEFISVLSYLSLLVGNGAPDKILGSYLEKL